jgi:Ion transport protein
VIFICTHYFLRKTCEALALLNISTKVFRKYFSSIWVFFDLIAIILTLTAVVWDDKHPDEYRPGFNSFVLGLLWIKVLGFLKVVNREMSTFILALIQILGDMRYFMLVLLVILFMFGDMMHIAVGTKDNGQFCVQNMAAGTLSPPAEDFCSPDQSDYYLRMYALLLGNFELDDYKDTKGMTAIFIVFTLIGVIILLNVLIAIISDSYEKAKIRSLLLFGRCVSIRYV